MGLDVTKMQKLGFGLMRLPEKDGAIDLERVCNMVDRYMKAGFNYFDTAYVLDKMSIPQFVRMVRNHGTDKILFATDSPWGGQKEFVDCFNAIDLTEEERILITQKNAERLLKM